MQTMQQIRDLGKKLGIPQRPVGPMRVAILSPLLEDRAYWSKVPGDFAAGMAIMRCQAIEQIEAMTDDEFLTYLDGTVDRTKAAREACQSHSLAGRDVTDPYAQRTLQQISKRRQAGKRTITTYEIRLVSTPQEGT